MKHRNDNLKQISFASAEFAAKKRVTRREKFLGEINQMVPFVGIGMKPGRWGPQVEAGQVSGGGALAACARISPR